MKSAAAEFADPEQRKKRRGREAAVEFCNQPSRAAEPPQPAELCCEYSAYMLLYQHQFDIAGPHPNAGIGALAIKSP
jgi:hypothetical protein